MDELRRPRRRAPRSRSRPPGRARGWAGRGCESTSARPKPIATPNASPSASLPHQAAGHVDDPVVGELDPVDEPGDQQQRDRVVHPRLALERPRESLAQARAAQDGEDRGAVGRGHRGADQQALERREVEEPDGDEPGDHRGDHGADRRQRDRGPEHRADLAPAGGETALEQDQDQADRAQRAGELGVGRTRPRRGPRSRPASRARGTAAGRARGRDRPPSRRSARPRAAAPRSGSARSPTTPRTLSAGR